VRQRHGTIVRLDDLDERRAVAADPAGYLRDLAPPVLVDEYQHVPEVLSVVKAHLSKHPGQVGGWLLCGSVSVDAVAAAAESLGRRQSDLTMGTLTLDERRELDPPRFLQRLLDEGPGSLQGWKPPARLDRRDLLTEAISGGFPLVVDQRQREGAARRLLADWVSAAVVSDGAAIAGVRNTEELRRMLRLYAAATASVTPKDRPTADRLEIGRATVARYRSLLADLHVTWDLPPLVPGNATGQVTRSAKLHLVDSGLAAHLTGRDTLAALGRDEAFTGALVETMVANDLRVQAEAAATPVRLYHYREGDREVDLVVERPDGRVVGVEIKLSANPGAGDLRGLARLRRSCGDRFAGGLLLARVPAGRQLDGFTVAPLEAVWFQR
jgi:predicted AAA+ superfamily ATPase